MEQHHKLYPLLRSGTTFVTPLEIPCGTLQRILRLFMTSVCKLGGKESPALTAQSHDAAAFPEDADATVFGDLKAEYFSARN